MVMEASPSPQCVGREFVRQYYTLLNNAPSHLHRFYNNYSSFIHGGLETNRESTPAIGQKQIHQKIQALNFQDCHAKINQVDSQLTLGSGVVVQVSGELSNAGHPMRRFTQTFVLAPQAPKKYYVHNDIFRYQDFGVIEDSVQQNQAQLVTKMSNVDHNQPQQQPPMTQQQIYYSMPPQQQIHPVMQQVTINGSVHEESSIISQQPLQQQTLQQQQPQQYIAEPTNQEQFQRESEQNSQQQQQPSVKNETQSVSETHEHQETDNTYAPANQEAEHEHQHSMQNTSSSGPKTYANLVKSFPSVGTTSPQIPKPSITPPPIQNLRIDERASSHQQSAGSMPTSTGVPSNQHQRMGNASQQQSQQQQYQPRMQRPGGQIQRDGERRTGGSRTLTDAHQLFLGNLPHNASENDLKQLFEKFGRVADIRVHSKQNDRIKGPPGQGAVRVPNYGFITFEDVTVVQKVLESCPIYFPDDATGAKLNIEEKKIRPREGPGGNRPNSDGNMRPMGNQQSQQQRGPGGPGGMMRGGQHGTRGRGSFNRGGGEGGRGGLRQSSSNPNNQNYQNRR
ncbi:hypothetical protein QAD02_002014 [Eretmocerus hayati]|uniref:Uncharacterized protein n=1 Tax=Eretmocerus hayati TaxID=131215 RepID=A0ACC2NMG8_9HYME|nr:hypothetical protein QAD02_002014 [Eretmocerus hayati]